MEDLEVGDRLFRVNYWSGISKCKREIEGKKIGKVNPKTYKLSW